MCDMITDSMVLCFFIDTDKIQSILQSDASIEDFLWKVRYASIRIPSKKRLIVDCIKLLSSFLQESALVLLKLLRPQIFEKMAMQELRALVSPESSKLATYVPGESIEIDYSSIGLLLEGFVKPIGIQEELIGSPAALLLSNGNQSFHNLSEASSSTNLIALKPENSLWIKNL